MFARLSRFTALLLALVAFFALPGRAAAQLVPHFSSGVAHFTSANDFVGEGHATHLGRYTEVGNVSFTPSGTPGILTVKGSIVYTAANGDELHATVFGKLDPATGAINARLTYSGGTGRFDDATGNSTLIGQLDASGAITVAVVGQIEY